MVITDIQGVNDERVSISYPLMPCARGVRGIYFDTIQKLGVSALRSRL
jgi:hypothetical protein